MEASAQTNAYLRARLNELISDVEQAGRDLGTARQRMQSVRGAARSSDGSVAVTVDARGQLTGLDIDARAYQRFSPSNLAAEILRLVRTAVDDATGQLGDVMAPFLPAGIPYADVASGEVDIAGWMPSGPLTDDTYDAWRARLSGVETVDQGDRS